MTREQAALLNQIQVSLAKLARALLAQHEVERDALHVTSEALLEATGLTTALRAAFNESK